MTPERLADDRAHPPLITVIMPHRTAEAYVADAVRSILGQTLTDLRLVVTDDASPTDGWIEALRPFGADPRLRLLRTDVRVGPFGIANAVLARSSSPFVAFQDADDVSHPTRFAQQVGALETGTCDIVGCSYERIDEAGRSIERVEMDADGNSRRERHGGLLALHGSLMIARRVVESIGGFDATTLAGADSDFLLRAAHLFHIRNLPGPLYQVRSWEGQITRSASHGLLSRYRNDYRDRMFLREDRRRSCRAREDLWPLLQPEPGPPPCELRSVALPTAPA